MFILRSMLSVVRLSVTLATLAVGLLLISSAAAPAALSTQGSLPLHARFVGTFDNEPVCPSGWPSDAECSPVKGHGAVRGLGSTSLSFTWILVFPNGVDDPCRLVSAPDAVFAVAGKGEIRLSATNPSCQTWASGVPNGSMDFTVTGGSGIYTGATGGGMMTFTLNQNETPWHALSEWNGTLAVPGLDFDTTPPTINGAGNKVVAVGKHARGARVRYAVTASDAADGAVSVACRPRSGSFFRVGKRRVRCSATDSSANSASKRFTVVVRRR